MHIPSIFDDLDPADLGLPAKIAEFRDIQRQMGAFGLYGRDGKSTKRFRLMGAPTGSGKTAAAEAIGIASGMRYVILTATKGLQDQRAEDGFPSVDIRGRANYRCQESKIGHPKTCAEGEEDGCELCYTKHCTYGGVLEEAKKARGVSTNYAYWMAARSTNSGALETPGAPIGLAILDELHLSVQQLSSFLGTWIDRQDLARFGGKKVRGAFKSLAGADWAVVKERWLELLGDVLTGIAVEQANIQEDFESRADAMRSSKEFRRLEKLSGNLDRVARLGDDGNWIWYPTKNGVKFDCVWPRRYAERFLFSGVSRVIGMSATLRPKCMSLLGIKRTDYDYHEWPRVFPPHLSPVYFWPLGKMGRAATEEDKEATYKGIDNLFLARRDRNMMIHTASYSRAEDFQRYCVEAGPRMILSEPGSAAIAAEKFRRAPVPAVLCSPSFQTGWDFPMEQVEVNVIPKLPFASLADPVVQARKVDQAFEMYRVAQDIQQATGRPTRSETDRSETFLTDAAYQWFQFAAKEHFALGWRVTRIKEIPKCPPKL